MTKKEYDKKRREESPEKMQEYYSSWYAANKERAREYARKYRETHKDERREYFLRFRENNKEKVSEYRHKYYKKNKDKILEANQARGERRRGLLPGEYKALLIFQGGGCLICGTPPGKKRLCIDHDHSAGSVRGLLCIECNAAIGLLRDNPALCRNAAAYLERRTG